MLSSFKALLYFKINKTDSFENSNIENIKGTSIHQFNNSNHKCKKIKIIMKKMPHTVLTFDNIPTSAKNKNKNKIKITFSQEQIVLVYSCYVNDCLFWLLK